ncbi:MAG: DUF1269 domain-containing protein [Chloroflexia bacterium]
MSESERWDGTESGPKTGPTGDPDSDMALQLVIARFADETAADAGFNTIKDAERQEGILVRDAAVVNRTDGNTLHVRDEHDWPGRVGALLGGGIGAVLGMLAGPLGFVVGGAAGAAIGAGAAAGRDSGMSDQKLKEFAVSLGPGGSMVIVAVARFWSAATADILKRAGGDVSVMDLTDEIAQQLDLEQK